ncbi:MAG: polysaccharide deacetylase family protein [Marinilabilia sp.]
MLSTKNKVVFVLSEKQYPDPVNVFFQEIELPVLFGLNKGSNEIFREDENGNIIFRQDLLSSVFYLLSGQQETETDERDQFGRFPYSRSIQKKLSCVHLPLVNYYFEMILSGLEAYARKQGKEFRRLRLFDGFGFTLSHDVDRIAFYHPLLVLYRIKQLLGLAPLNYSKKATVKYFFSGVLFNLNPFRKGDPWWNFQWMINLEKRLGIRSTFFFLKQENRFDNSLYKFHFKKIRNLIHKLKEEKFEVGLHGTIQSTYDLDNLMQQTEELARITHERPVGIRQHYLSFKHPDTFKVQQEAGFCYDTTLAFAEHDGYRNGYCHPFHPYDFENDCMMKIWEIPLVMMEVSVLNYRKAGFSTMKNAVRHYIAEAKKFGGIFSLLWHNCRLSDHEFSGTMAFYENLLEEIIRQHPEVMPGDALISKVSYLRDEQGSC